MKDGLIGTRRPTRRAMLADAAVLGMIAPVLGPLWRGRPVSSIPADTAERVARQSAGADPGPLHALAAHAIDAAVSRGASYADARLTRTVIHRYFMGPADNFVGDEELIGVGVRVLVNGSWGFAASPFWDAEDVAQLAADAVAQAKANATMVIRPVELGKIAPASGTWATPVTTDPFTVSVEEKVDHIVYWKACAAQAGIPFVNNGAYSSLRFVRQERVFATSEGARVAQTVYETGGKMRLRPSRGQEVLVRDIDSAGQGWELFDDAKLFAQFPQLLEEARRPRQRAQPANVGRYALVCDGDIMAQILDQTLGVATQLDRALGYEANAAGTSYLNDPLGMAGTFQAAAPLVTVTANRSAPAQLATVQWDDDGVEPVDTTLVTKGVITDFQTTREQAAWLAPYYHKTGRAVRSNGCATAENALAIPLQNVPNLALAPNATDVGLDALVANVDDGILIEGGRVRCDFQGRNGLIIGERMREIKNGKVGTDVIGGVYFNSLDFWKRVTALGGRSTTGSFRLSQYDWGEVRDEKGEPAQRTSHTVQAVAATIANQALIDPWRKA